MDDELEEDASFLDEIGRLLDSRKKSTLFLPHRTKLFSDSHCFFHIAQNCFLITLKHNVA